MCQCFYVNLVTENYKRRTYLGILEICITGKFFKLPKFYKFKVYNGSKQEIIRTPIKYYPHFAIYAYLESSCTPKTNVIYQLYLNKIF